jgi:hypothetical protein
MSDLKDGEPENRIINEPMSEALSKRYLAYALSTITARALPDVRDGLKPVQRRILYGMRVLRLDPEGGYRKCAKIVGDVMGNFTRTATARSTTRWCAWRRISPFATRWSMVRATLATSMAIAPRPIVTPRRG